MKAVVKSLQEAANNYFNKVSAPGTAEKWYAKVSQAATSGTYCSQMTKFLGFQPTPMCQNYTTAISKLSPQAWAAKMSNPAIKDAYIRGFEALRGI